MKPLALFLLSLTFASQGWGQVQMDRINATGVNGVINPTRFQGSDIGAQINAADAFLVSGTSAVMEIPPAASRTATTLITIGKNHALVIRGNGVFTDVGIRFSDSTSDYSGSGYLICPEHAVLRLANGVNLTHISQTNYASLTGTTNQYGVNGVVISGCIIDGNQANNTSGYGVLLYGRNIHLFDLTIHDAKQDCLRVEGHDAPAFNAWQDTDLSVGTNLHLNNCGGDGLNDVGHQGWTFNFVEMFNNGNYGLESTAPIVGHYIQSYKNTAGGCRFGSGGSPQGSNWVCTTATGDGALFDTGAALAQLASSQFSAISGVGGVAAVHIKTSAAIELSGGADISNSAIGIKFDGGSNLTFNGTFNNMTGGNWFDCTSMNGTGAVTIVSSDNSGTFLAGNCGTWGSGSLQNFAFSGSGLPSGLKVTQFTTQTICASGWCPVLPNSNQPLPAIDISSNWTAAQTFNAGLTSAGLTASGTSLTKLGQTAVGSLPSAASNPGAMILVTDSTAVASEGQTCVGSSTNKAVAISNGVAWHCF